MSIKKINPDFENYEYNNSLPIYCNTDDLTQQQRHLLDKSKVFCMLPWIHIHGAPDGRAYPCCISEMDSPVGNLREHTLKEVWNSDEYKQIRQNMLNNKETSSCSKCYELEKNGIFSMRQSFSKDFGHLIDIVDKTQSDGTLDEFKLKYIDIRFSNLCNFRCRSCGPLFSSNWFNDHIKLYNRKPDVNGRELNSVEYAGRSKYDIWGQLQEHIPYIEQIYFAGGEPLIMEEHYLILDELIRQKRFNVRLTYNTNFSVMTYKDKNVFDYWKQFNVVSVGASLDSNGARGEYMRKGQVWKETEENRRQMLTICPNVDFYVSSTISIYNILQITEFHREWVDLGLVKPEQWNVNICQSPDFYRVDILPDYYKQIAIEKLKKHIEWLEPQDSLTRATVGFKGLLNFLQQTPKDKTLLNNFFTVSDKIDAVRDEKFEDVFPEYADLRTYVTTR